MMTRVAVAALVASLSLSTAALAAPTTKDPAQVPAGEYVLDTRHASVSMNLSHMGGFSNYAMRFDKITGGFTYDPAKLAATKLTVTIDPKSIHTGLPTFDEEISGKFFQAEKFPTITFVSTDVKAAADGKGMVTGDLTFLGVTKPVTLDVTFYGVGPGMMGSGTRMGFSASGKIKRSDFGMTAPGVGAAGDEVSLVAEVEFTKK